jgi:hypothetical protein
MELPNRTVPRDWESLSESVTGFPPTMEPLYREIAEIAGAREFEIVHAVTKLPGAPTPVQPTKQAMTRFRIMDRATVGYERPC